jgi:hypothetical protein
MEDTQPEIIPTSKDFAFYSKFYSKNLRGDEDGIQRWIRNMETRLEKLSYGDELYVRQEIILEKYKDRLVKNRELQTQAVDGTNELFVTYVVSQLVAKEKLISNNIKKKAMVKDKKDKEKNCLQTCYKNESTANRAVRQSKRDINYFYNRMLQIDDEMPRYMKESLQNMPTNKGFIYRGVWYFGSNPVSPEEERTYLTMFERIKGIQYIHEYIYKFPWKTYNVYEKLSKQSPKTLVKHEIFEMR